MPNEIYGSGRVPKTSDTRRMLLVKELQATNLGGGGGGGGGSTPIGNPGTFQAGIVALGNGVSSGTVTGLALPGTPFSYQLNIKSPVNGLTLESNVVSGTETSDGFSYVLSGTTDSTLYVLAWTAAF